MVGKASFRIFSASWRGLSGRGGFGGGTSASVGCCPDDDETTPVSCSSSSKSSGLAVVGDSGFELPPPVVLVGVLCGEVSECFMCLSCEVYKTNLWEINAQLWLRQPFQYFFNRICDENPCSINTATTQKKWSELFLEVESVRCNRWRLVGLA